MQIWDEERPCGWMGRRKAIWESVRAGRMTHRGQEENMSWRDTGIGRGGKEVCDECFRISGIQDSRVRYARTPCIRDLRYSDMR
jgi:hypothetical protein